MAYGQDLATTTVLLCPKQVACILINLLKPGGYFSYRQV